MKRVIASTSLFALLIAVAVPCAVGATPQPGTLPPDAKARLGATQVPFVANQGQLDPRVAFSANTFAGTVFVTKDGSLVMSLPTAQRDTQRIASPATPGWTLVEKPLAAAPLHAMSQRRAATKVSVFRGNDPSKWERELATYSQVDVGEPWKGVSLSYAAHGDNVERLFTLAPGVDVGVIRMNISGANALVVMDGSLHIKTGLGDVDLSRPRAYQLDAQGVEHDVAVRYILRGKGYGFRLGRHDIHRSVVIDPLIQATYLGGSYYDVAYAMAVGSSGQVYVAGATASTDFPGTAGGSQAACATTCGTFLNVTNAFVAEFSGDLKTLIQATYLGGSGTDSAYAMALGSSGQVYVAGQTQSTNFPGTTGGYQAACADGGGTCAYGDVFVAELSGDLKSLTQATYLGGSGDDSAGALAIGLSGQVYVTGETQSANFPGTSGGYQAACGDAGYGTCSWGDVFVAELSGDLKTLTQATYLGGTYAEYGHALAVGSSGQVYVAGLTYSTDFPGTTGGYQATSAGPGTPISTAFVAEFSGDLKTLIQATYLGGSHEDIAWAMVLGASGQVYVAGETRSVDFPGTTGGYQAACGDTGGTCAIDDAFVAELSGDLKTLTQATYLGGGSMDIARALALGSSGQVYVAGYTESADFPGTTGGYQAACADTGGTCTSGDGFVVELSGDLKILTEATYLGGSGVDSASALAIGSSGQVYVGGGTHSINFPGTTGGYQAACADTGGTCIYADAYIAEFSDLKAPTPPTASVGSFSVNENASGIGTLSGAAGNAGDTLKFSVVTPPSHGTVTLTNVATGDVSYTPAVGYSGSDSFMFKVTDNQNGLDSGNATESITVNAISSGGSPGGGSGSTGGGGGAFDVFSLFILALLSTLVSLRIDERRH